jgi:ABC-2 type transport system permease protein
MIKNMKALIRREFWEHRGAFIKTPIIISTVLLVIAIVGYIIGLVFANKTGSTEIMDKGINELHKLSETQLSTFWDVQLISTSTLFLFVLFIVLFFFILGSLFDDRKDGSIQFWKSLPISDAETVLSKLITAMIFVPLVFTAVFAAYMLANMVLTSILLIFHGQNPWTLVWVPASVGKGILTMLIGALTQMLWAMPIYGWLMFSSSWSKRRPFLFAIFIPLLVAVSWYFLNVVTRMNFVQVEMFKWPAKFFMFSALPYGTNASNGFQINLGEGGMSLIDIASNLKGSIMHVEIIYGIIFAAVFIALSIWVRRYRNTT